MNSVFLSSTRAVANFISSLFDTSRGANVGQNVNDAPGMYALACQVFKGDALATFNAAATIAGAETIAKNYQQVI
jgi:hypothetical protein